MLIVRHVIVTEKDSSSSGARGVVHEPGSPIQVILRGLKPRSFGSGYAALKGRSSTLLPALSPGLRPLSFPSVRGSEESLFHVSASIMPGLEATLVCIGTWL